MNEPKLMNRQGNAPDLAWLGRTINATVLHLLGMDYTQPFYRRHGQDEKLTGVFECRVGKEILS
ncbi:MAG: hypothetical protein VB875_04770 [Pirellulales bacterium]